MHFMYIPRRRCGLQASSAVSYGKTVGMVLYPEMEANRIQDTPLAMFAVRITKAVILELVKLQIEKVNG